MAEGEKGEKARSEAVKAIGGAVSEVGKAGSGALKMAAGAAKSVGNAISSAPDMAEKMADPKGYEATKQLEKEGAILPMAAGTNFARPDEEKKMIQDRVKQNENEKKSEIKTPDLNTMTGIAKEEAYNKEIAAIDPNARLSEQIGARMSAAAKRYNPMGKQGAEIKKETQKDLLKAAKEQGKEKLAAVKGEKGKLEEGRATAMEDYDKASGEVEAYKSTPEFTERAELVKELTEKAQKTHEGFSTGKRIFNDAARKEDREARKAQSQLRQMGGAEDPKLAELTKKQDLAGAAVRQIDTKLENIEEKLKATEEFDTAATTASEISEEGQQRADLLDNDLLDNKEEELKKSEETTAEETTAGAPTAGAPTAGAPTAGASTASVSATSGASKEASKNKNITKFKDKKTGAVQTIDDKKTAAKNKIAKAKGAKDLAAQDRPPLMKRIADKLKGKPLDPKEQDYQNAVKDEKEGQKESKDATRLGKAVKKADSLSNQARELMKKEDSARDPDPKNQTPHSGSYQRAEKLVKEYDSLESPEDAEKFVQEQEKRSKAIAKASKGLDSPEEFKKFVKRFDGDKGEDGDK